MADRAKWNFMVYLAGDNNLASAGDTDLKEMREVGSTDGVNVVAQFDSAGDRGAVRFRVRRQGQDEDVRQLGPVDSGDPQTLIDFVEWAAEAYPAERHCLVLWNHGGGWEPSEMDRVARSVGAPNYSPREMSERSSSPLRRTLFRTSLEKIFSLPSPEERAICSDDATGHSLDTVELGRVLDRVVAKLGQPLDLLGMDACLMSNLEVAYQVRRHAKFMVASEENEPNNGWPYDAVLRGLTERPDQTADELAAHVVGSYLRFYTDRNHEGSITQAAYDLARVDEVAGPVDALADALVAHMPGAAMEIWKSQRGSARFWHNTLWDLSHFCQELERETSGPEVRAAARGVLDALGQGPGRFVLAEQHSGAKVGKCGGCSIYFLPPIQDLSRYYGDLDYAKERRWHNFLQAYHAA